MVFIFGWNHISKLLSKKIWFAHLYIIPRKITFSQEQILYQNYNFYRKLKPNCKKVFNHRVATFINHYQFFSRQEFTITEDTKTLIAGCYVMITFGMKNYLARSFDKILVYPSSYFSNTTKQENMGEYNPNFKIVVFSWEHFLEGINIDNNNLNLGIHEFTHALLESGIYAEQFDEHDYKNEYYTSFTEFGLVYKEIMAHISAKHNNDLLKNSGYFRDYAFTNDHEFISVMLEHFFETPEEFRRNFPLLYEKVTRMINYQEVCFN